MMSSYYLDPISLACGCRLIDASFDHEFGIEEGEAWEPCPHHRNLNEYEIDELHGNELQELLDRRMGE